MLVTSDLTAASPSDSPSPAVRAAYRRVERARAFGQLPPADSDSAGPAGARRPEERRAGAGRGGGARAGTHVVDRALAYRRHAAGGMAAVAIARRVRKSKSHVSILLRLGEALEGLEPGDLAALRTPAVTWRLVQRLVRGDTRVQGEGERLAGVLALRRALRDAVAGFSSHTVDRRRHRKGRTPGAAALERFDPGAFSADPAGLVAAHLERLVAAHEAFARQALRMLDHALAAERLAAVPLSALARLSRPQLAAIAARGRERLTPAQQQAVDALEAASRIVSALHGVGRDLAEGSRKTAAGPPAPRAAGSGACGVGRGPDLADHLEDAVTAEDVAEDVAE